MTIHALDKNFLLEEIPVGYRDRPEGSESKLNTFSDGFRVLKTIGRLFMEYKPLTFFNTVSAILVLIAIGFFIPVFREYLITGLVKKFPTLIVSGVILMVGECFGFVELYWRLLQRNTSNCLNCICML
jgi:hypothetical protein